MKRVIREILPVSIAALALLLGACGQDPEPVTAPDVTSSAESPDATVSDSPETDTPQNDTVVAGDEEPSASAPQVDAGELIGAEMSGTLRTSDWIPSCSIGPPWSEEPADCERFGDYTILPVTIPGVRTGTLDGMETFYGTYAVADDGSYLLAGISSFVGTVGECGEGTIVFNTAAWGTFDLDRSAELGQPVSGAAEAISYTATKSKLATIDVALSMSASLFASPEVEITGTVACNPTDASIAAARPDSAVSVPNAFDWTGASTFAQGETCIPFGPIDEACPTVDGFVVHGLANTLTFSGSHDGTARFVGTNLISSDVDYEHSGIIVFEGTVEGCGAVSSINVNEAAGNGFESGFEHTRGFTPAGFDPGPTGVFVDGGASQTGLISGGLAGFYSCEAAQE